MADPVEKKQPYGRYGYMHLGVHEIVRTTPGGGPHLTSLPPSALGKETKPWLMTGRPQADALPRRFRDGLPLPPGVVEGVLARPDPAVPELEPAAPYTAPRRRQPVYEAPQGGGCLCGSVRFAVNATKEPHLVLACHCRSCQKLSGAPHLAWGTLDADDFVLLQGELASYSSGGTTRRFCPCCGTQISFQRADAADQIDVALHALDNPDLWHCELNIWTEHRVAARDVDALPGWARDPARLLGAELGGEAADV